MVDSQNVIAKLEALLFAYGEPMARARVRKTLGIDDAALAAALTGLREALAAESRGLMLLEDGESVQLVTKPALQGLLADLVKAEFEGELTPAALETVSIVSYAGPLTRAEVEFIRGVNSSFILRALAIRGLVDRAPHPSRPNVLVYNPSMEFLRHVGVSAPEALPDRARYQDLIRRMREATSD